MPSLAGAITTLGLAGIPFGAPVFDSEYQTTPRPYTQTFTQPGLDGSSVARHVTYTKTEASVATLDVSDTASLSATEEPIDQNELATTDTARLSATDVSQLFNRIDVSDTAALAANETISLVISGVTLKSVSDTASLSSSETSALGITIDVSDTASLSATDSSSVAVSAENLSVTDAANLSADDAQLLEIFAGIVEKIAFDSALLTVVDIALVREVRRIRRISLELRGPRITLEIL